MTLDGLFDLAGIEKPPIDELISIKSDDQRGPMIGKTYLMLEINSCDELGNALNNYIYLDEKETINYHWTTIIRFGYETRVKIDFFYGFGYEEFELSKEDQDYIHKLMDDYLKKEYGMTADEMWRKEW